MIVKPDDAEAILLRRCLDSVVGHVDGIFITQAGPKPNKNVSKTIKDFDGVETFFKWNNSFADARNYSFAQVPKDYDYIFWLDADDVVRGIEDLKETVEQNQSVDAFSLWYLYAFDEWKNPIVVHHKTRIVRNDGCLEWQGNLHEDFKENRQVMRKHIEGIEVLHLTNDDRIEQSKKRNVTVAKAHLKANPNDPRSYWNIGNALKAEGRNGESIRFFKKFLKTSLSDQEKYIVRLRLAELYMATGENETAVDELRYAIGMKPDYPDAYIHLGHLFYEMEKYQDAIELLKQGLVLKPPYYSIVVYNPRDYDYTPLKWLGYAYIAISQPVLALECFKALLEITPKDKRLKQIVEDMGVIAKKSEQMMKKYKKIKNLPKDKLKAELDALPEDFRAHPMFSNLRHVNFIKEESTGKDLVIVCGYTTREWNPDSVKEGIGGSEEAVIHLARRWKEAGYNVTVYNNCGHEARQFDGVTYAPFWEHNYRDKQDITILWRHPKMCDYQINSSKVYVDLHDVLPQGEFTEKRLNRIDKIFVKSQFHRSLFPNVPDEKFVVIPNGIEYAQFSEPSEKDPYLLINTSSPDRSLSTLIRLFKRVKEQVPEAKLQWAYGFGVFDDVHKNNPAIMKWKDEILEDMEKAGVENLGRVSHEVVAEMYKKARVFAYPTEFAEIDCISARKAQAGGAIPVTTDFGALNETVQYGVKVHSDKTKDNWCAPYQFDFGLQNQKAEDEWVDAVVDILKTPVNEDALTQMRESTQKDDWSEIAKKWLVNM